MTDKERVEIIDDERGPDFSEKVYDASDPEQVNLRRRKSGRVLHEKRKYIAEVMARKEGRRWVWELLTASHVFSTSFVSGDAHATSFHEGERNIGLRILTDVMTAAPDQYVTMTTENS